MLKILRHKRVKKKIYYGLAIAVVFTFVVSGVLISQDDDKTTSTLAKFGKRGISVHEYLDHYRAVQRQASWMYGDNLNEMRSRLNFKGEAWDRMLMLEEAKKRKVRASDKEVIDWITGQQGFHKDGKFNDAFYREYVERGLRSTPRQFEEEIREMLTLSKLSDEVKKSLPVTDEELKELYKSEKVERDIVYGLLSKENLRSETPFSDKQLQQAYEALNKAAQSEEDSKRSEQEIKDALKEDLLKAEEGTLAITKLQALKGRMKDAADFEKVLESEKIKPVPFEKYKKGTYPEGIWPSENLQNAVEKLEPGAISDAFEVPKGAMIAKVTKVYPFDEKKFEEERSAYRERVESEKARTELEKLLEEQRAKLSLDLELMKELFPADAA